MPNPSIERTCLRPAAHVKRSAFRVELADNANLAYCLSMVFNFRKLRNDDYEVYRLLRLDCLRNFPDNFGSSHDEEIETLSRKFQVFTARPASAFLFGAFDEQKLIGMVGFKRFDRRKTRHRGEIVHMYVDLNYSGRGVGARLLQKAIEAAFEIEEVEQLELGVVANNSQAVKLYEKFGFKTLGVQPNYFKDGEQYWHQQLMQLRKDEYKIQRQEL